MTPITRALRGTVRRGLPAALLTAGLLGLAAPGATALVPTAAEPSGACPDDTGVTVVVDKTDLGGEVEIGCATTPGTGTEVLQAAGFTDVRDDSGLICAIDSLPDPCPAEFTGSYWSYWYAEAGGEWQTYLEGSDTAQPAAGSVEGWRYNDGSQPPSVEAPVPGEGEEPAVEETEEPAEEAPADDDGATAGPAPEGSGEQSSSGPSPVLLTAAGVIAVLAAGAVLLARRRSAHGPAGQD